MFVFSNLSRFVSPSLREASMFIFSNDSHLVSLGCRGAEVRVHTFKCVTFSLSWLKRCQYVRTSAASTHWRWSQLRICKDATSVITDG